AERSGMERVSNYLVIGSGIAGLSFALRAAKTGTVTVITKKEAAESSTNYAQGGIATVWSGEDTFESHIEDTHRAGAGLCHPDVVDLVVRDAPARIKELIAWGVRFTRRSGMQEFDLGREGGHSRRRIFHAKDLTGREVERALLEQARRNPRIKLHENHVGINLITRQRLEAFDPHGADEALGAYVLDQETGKIHTCIADATILSTGGVGKVYLYTSNPDIATGDGIAMAYRAGATIANMEFVQFHPTCLYHPHAKSFLISEAVRGEGAVLLNRAGKRFMQGVHPMAELAPRDIVARAIDSELKRTGEDCVYLDITRKGASFIRERFPNIHETCLSFGIDMTKEAIPVVPAAHYLCGGVRTDLHGETDIRRLFAVGECACTGLHGANRLASNSLLEALVYSDRAVRRSKELYVGKPRPRLRVPKWDPGKAQDSDEAVVVSQNWDEIRRLMWNYVGIVRSNKRLSRALDRIELLKREIQEYYWNFKVTGDLLELRNICTTAELIVRCAMQRKESRGLHTTIDYPYLDDDHGRKDTLIRRERF
ncbi:MAG TPA: L-aspartate oxidase, partial [Candidatus Deferrimicrobiaceae bacterium]|nr:L-aspartate oxidase [Candidatus Deferrimicrobiaceae bacterium]